jgi:hypothetical protein
VRFVIGPYDAGPYVEGSYIVDIPMTAPLMGTVAAPYRKEFNR